jgi:hypothetical protein
MPLLKKEIFLKAGAKVRPVGRQCIAHLVDAVPHIFRGQRILSRLALDGPKKFDKLAVLIGRRACDIHMPKGLDQRVGQ